ncbi:MAG TPA: M56 family metallopeptidase [Candidatus Eisenbacteria bacterium]|nr:M56 family metallopeptidase [Candidatus Eisenbacteria bacterium]
MSLFEVGSALLRASVAGGVAAAVAWALIAVWRHRIPSSLRAWIWWLVAAHFLIALIPAQPIEVPQATRTPALATLAAPSRAAAEQAEALTARVTDRVAWRSPSLSPDLWVGLLVASWLLGVAFVAVRHLRALRGIERAWKRADGYDATPDELEVIQAMRTGTTPEVRVTHDFDMPATLAGRHPRILLPAEAVTLSKESRQLVLAHECAHVARHDLSFGWLPAAVETLFWFHPLARWASSEYGQAREEACDERALLSTSASPRAYGELLMHFGVAPRSLSTIASCGSPTRGALLRRLLMLDASKSSSRWGRIAGAVLITMAALSLAPLELQAKGDKEASDEQSRTPANLRIERFAYLLVERDGNTMGGSMRTGGGYDDAGDARKARTKMGGGRIWWFRLDSSKYALDDPETMASVQAVYEKEDELQKRVLGMYDERLDALSRSMERLHPKLENLEVRRQKLDVERDALADARDEGKSVKELEAKLRELEASLKEVEDAYEPLSDEQEQISREMETVSEGREKSYREWEKQELEFRSQLRRIAEDAVKRGVATKL